MDSIDSSDAVANIVAKYDNLITVLQNEAGYGQMKIGDVLDVYHALETESAALLAPPSWFNDTLMNELKDLTRELSYLIYSDDLAQKVISSPLLQLIASQINRISTSNDIKMFVMTTKREKLLSFLASAKVNTTDKIYPSFGSAIAIEIYKSIYSGMFVNLLYNENPEKSNWLPLSSEICQNQINCPLDSLLHKAENLKQDTNQLCATQVPAKVAKKLLQSTKSPYIRHEVDDVDLNMGADIIPIHYAKSSSTSGTSKKSFYYRSSLMSKSDYSLSGELFINTLLFVFQDGISS